MKKAYKRILSTAMVLSIVIQGNTVFAKEISTSQKNETKKLVFVYERKNSKDYLDILINGKSNHKEIKDGKLCELVEGIDIAVLESKESTDLKSDMTKLIKNGAEAFIYIDGEDVDVFSADEVSSKIKKSTESKEADKRTLDSKKIEVKESKVEESKKEKLTKEEPKKETDKRENSSKESSVKEENKVKEEQNTLKSKKVKVEITYRQKDSSNELISLKKASTTNSTLTSEKNKKEENKKEENKNEENKTDENNQQTDQNKDEDKNNNEELNFNSEDVLGKTSTELVGDYYVIGKEESNFANLINDALLSKTGADIAMTNAGSILRSIPKGEITYGNIVESVIFGNTVITKKLTGKQIRDAIEVGAEIYPEANSTFLHFGNVTYKMDANKKAGSRVTEVKVKGVKLDDSKQYVVAMNDYMSTDYNSISGSSVEKNYGELDKVIAEYIKSKGTLNYKNDGRIKITKKVTVTINRDKVKKVVTAIDKLTYDKTTSNIKSVNNAIKMFNDLNQDERKQVTNYKKLVKIADSLRKDGASVNKPSSTNSSSSSSSSSTNSSKEKQKSPKTGDASSVVGAAGTFITAAVGLGVLRRKKED